MTNPTPTPIALITGGSRGLGRNAALALAAQGSDVILTYVQNAEEAGKVVAQIQALGRRAAALPLDTRNTAGFADFTLHLKALLAQHWQRERFDHLINNAGFGLRKSFADTQEDEFDALMNVHFKGVFFLTQTLLPLIEDGGRILNVSTGLTRFTFPNSAAYAAMKGAVEVLTRHLAKELGPRRITVNVIAPGAIETDFGGGLTRDNAQVNAFIATQTALGRAGLPEDIGAAMASLLAPGSRWITGERIEASGGMFL
jgi:NAD(P)-dependent dehydrogenase (short-subunit alcohol dehydrogenase family)